MIQARNRGLTGWHVLTIALVAFATVLAANLAMLLAATGSFPGLIVQNSYVASQGWDERRRAQEALGWHAAAGWQAGRLMVRLHDDAGAPVRGVSLEARIGRPSDDGADRTARLASGPDGTHAASVALDPGLWRVELRTATGPAFTRVQTILVPAEAR